jgi:hypothetical protein
VLALQEETIPKILAERSREVAITAKEVDMTMTMSEGMREDGNTRIFAEEIVQMDDTQGMMRRGGKEVKGFQVRTRQDPEEPPEVILLGIRVGKRGKQRGQLKGGNKSEKVKHRRSVLTIQICRLESQTLINAALLKRIFFLSKF